MAHMQTMYQFVLCLSWAATIIAGVLYIGTKHLGVAEEFQISKHCRITCLLIDTSQILDQALLHLVACLPMSVLHTISPYLRKLRETRSKSNCMLKAIQLES